MRYRIEHSTTYRYAEPVSRCHNLAHLRPRDTQRQRCLTSHLQVSPVPAVSNVHIDYFGNHVNHITIQAPHRELRLEAFSEVETVDALTYPPLDQGKSCGAVLRHLADDTDAQTLLAREYVLASPLVGIVDGLAEYARASFESKRPLVSATSELVARMHEDFTYDPEFTTISTPLTEVLAHRRGVCQDFAHLAIGCLRSLGFAARYVSGYIETLPPPGKPKMVGADESHAWFAVFTPDHGWVDFDPTNNSLVQQQHVTVALGRDYSDVTPLRGVIFGGGSTQELKVSVTMEPQADG